MSNNKELEELLFSSIDNFLSTNNKLYFPKDNNKFSAYWDPDSNSWKLKDIGCDPLSIIVLNRHPERYFNSDDDYIISTIAKMLEKPTWWVLSFQDGWIGKSNTSSSISGFLLGKKLRIKYNTCQEEK